MTTIHRLETRTPFPIDRVNCYYIKDSAPTLIDAGVELSGAEVYIHKWDSEKMADDGESGFIKRIDRFRRFFVETGSEFHSWAALKTATREMKRQKR
jgi:hypothetical protein